MFFSRYSVKVSAENLGWTDVMYCLFHIPIAPGDSPLPGSNNSDQVGTPPTPGRTESGSGKHSVPHPKGPGIHYLLPRGNGGPRTCLSPMHGTSRDWTEPPPATGSPGTALPLGDLGAPPSGNTRTREGYLAPARSTSGNHKSPSSPRWTKETRITQHN